MYFFVKIKSNYVENVVSRYDYEDVTRHFTLSRKNAYHIIGMYYVKKIVLLHIIPL